MPHAWLKIIICQWSTCWLNRIKYKNYNPNCLPMTVSLVCEKISNGNTVLLQFGTLPLSSAIGFWRVCGWRTREGLYEWMQIHRCVQWVWNTTLVSISGVRSLDGPDGWWLGRHGLFFFAVYDGSQEPLCSVPPQIKTLGVFLNIGGGTLSFHNPLTQEHLATLPTRFEAAGVLPALGLGQGHLRLRCSLPPPPHVFLSKDSAYRVSCDSGGGGWRREITFQSVRKVIQKFEELAVSDSDSGLVSSFGSSSSTLASLPDLGIPGMVPSGQAGQETGAE